MRVKNNDKVNLRFEYDALGRRVAKINEYGKAEGHKITRFLWDGNVPLHEWSYPLSDRPETIDDSDGRRSYASPEPQTELTTWIFDEGTFVPSAKLVGERRYSIISDYLGTPIEAYDEVSKRVWKRELDIYGRVRIEQGEVGMVPFLYQRQYLDGETELAYNRFRYYSPETGAYISQDPIRLEAGLTNLYAYVHDVNAWVDPLGLAKVFRSMSRAEYFDIKHNGWNSYGQMESKWFANSYDDAVAFGHRLGHGTDSKFYIVGFEIDDEILSGAYKVKKLDAIGDALAIDIDQLNNSSTIVTSVNSQRVKIDSH